MIGTVIVINLDSKSFWLLALLWCLFFQPPESIPYVGLSSMVFERGILE